MNYQYYWDHIAKKPVPVSSDKPMPVTGNLDVQLSGSYVGYSTDTKPTENVRKGDTFLELDTKLIYFFDGSQWVVW